MTLKATYSTSARRSEIFSGHAPLTLKSDLHVQRLIE